MAGSVNKVILVGNLGKDPETKNFENGGMICSFPLATTESYWDKEKNQRIDQPTDWHSIRVGKPGLAKLAQQYLRKGSSVYVEGAIRYRQYQTKEGETKYITEVHVEELVLLGKSGSPAEATGSAPAARTEEMPPANFTPADGDDLPF
jgi:single-strand DNA-binding protein